MSILSNGHVALSNLRVKGPRSELTQINIGDGWRMVLIRIQIDQGFTEKPGK